MADVYRFKVRLRELEDYIWRDIEITSVSTVAKLVYAILTAFEAEGSHLFCMKFGDERCEIVFDDSYYSLFACFKKQYLKIQKEC